MHHHRLIKQALATAAVVAATCSPTAASAMLLPPDPPPSVSAPTVAVSPPVEAASGAQSGLNWDDAAIGLGGAIVLVGAGGTWVGRRRRTHRFARS